jgi:hypothetical protein
LIIYKKQVSAKNTGCFFFVFAILLLYSLSIPEDGKTLYSISRNLRTKEPQRKAPPVMGDASVPER